MPLPQWGGVVGENDGFEEFPADILGIPKNTSVSLTPYGFPSMFNTDTNPAINTIYMVVLPDNNVAYIIDVARIQSWSDSMYCYFSFDNLKPSHMHEIFFELNDKSFINEYTDQMEQNIDRRERDY